jgi:serine protease AprX
MAGRKRGTKDDPAQEPGPPGTGGSRTGRRGPEPGPGMLGMERATIPRALNDKTRRAEWGLPPTDSAPGRFMIELNLFYFEGLAEAAARFEELYKAVVGEQPAPVAISKAYYSCRVSMAKIRALVRRDEEDARREPEKRCIYKVWPDFPVQATMDRSVATVKADAAFRSYAATGAGVVWAVIDSGIDAKHLHFGHRYQTLGHPMVAMLHRDFTVDPPPPGAKSPNAESIASAQTDRFGHGTHVAGIIAGGMPDPGDDARPANLEVYENRFTADAGGTRTSQSVVRRESKDMVLRGVAPECKLVSLRVLNDNGAGTASDIIRALNYVRVELNGDPKMLRVHGVNLSVGYEFDAEMFACGQSPLCVEVDRLVKSGVVVVASAGNTGYVKLNTEKRLTRVGLSNTINDPGNAALAITVGATHRDAPHTYGVSYFSSKGPTGDGRLKPDIVAPGERITSCAAGRYLKRHGGQIPDDMPAYIDESGTSMAAPHVSGAIAAFLSIRQEFRQRPEDVKRIFLASATSLGRERYFEGHGLVDLMRAIQSV